MKDYKITVEIMKLKCPALPVVPPNLMAPLYLLIHISFG